MLFTSFGLFKGLCKGCTSLERKYISIRNTPTLKEGSFIEEANFQRIASGTLRILGTILDTSNSILGTILDAKNSILEKPEVGLPLKDNINIIYS